MSLNTNDMEFDFTESTEQFTKDFMNYVVTDVPLFALKDELLYFMNRRKSASFRIPAYKSIDRQEHVFYFTVKRVEENPRLKVYHYLGIDLEKKEQF